MSEEEIQASLQRAREHLQEKMREAPTLINAKESHQAALAKEKHMQKLKDALRIDEKHEFGAAFFKSRNSAADRLAIIGMRNHLYRCVGCKQGYVFKLDQ